MPCSKTHIESLREAAIHQPHFSHHRLSSGPLNSVVFVEFYLPPLKDSVKSLNKYVCCPHQFGFGRHLLLSSLQKKCFPRNNSWLADFRGKRSYSNANPTAMQMNDLCNNSVPACKNINNTHNVCHKFTTHICWHFTVKCLFRETNIIMFEQCILYKYFKSVEISLLYVCVHKQFEWMVEMWCFCFPK